MERIVYRITLDSHKTGIQRTLQGFETADNMARTIAVNITASGDTYEIPLDNVVAMMYVTTPGAAEPSINECRIEDNTIIYDVLPIVEEGITEMQLKLIETSVDGAKKVLIAPRFAVEVTESGTEDDGAEQTTTFTALEAAIAKAQGVYDARLLRIDIGEDCVFRAIYADGTVYENHYFYEALYNGNALLSESWAKGGIGIREGEETNNSKYFSDVSRSSSIEASASADEVRNLVDFAKLHSTYTSFDTNFETGELEYISASHTFDIDETTGELSVEGDLFDPSEVLESVADDYMDEKTQEIAQLKSDLVKETTARQNAVATEKAERKAEIAVERERINQFTALGEGSTTGDAELIDARIGNDGKAHTNLGEHIRSVSDDIEEIGTYDLLVTDDFTKVDGLYIDYTQGQIFANANACVAYIECQPNASYKIEKLSDNRFSVGYTTEIPKANIAVYNSEDLSTANEATITTGEDAKYIVIYYFLSTACVHSESELYSSLCIYGLFPSANDKTARKVVEKTYHFIHRDDYIKADGLFVNGQINQVQANTNANTLYIECKPNTKYKVDKIADSRFTVAYSDVIPSHGSATYGAIIDNNASEITITTNKSAKYLIVFYYLETTKILSKEIVFESIQIAEETETAIDYSVRDMMQDIVLVTKSGKYNTIQKGIDAVKNGGTVYVAEGIYYEQISTQNKDVHIIGLNKETCILQDDSGDYSTPPIEISGGSIQNMTIVETSSRATPSSSGYLPTLAYCIHADWDTMENKTLVISNCILKCNKRATMGVGARNGFTLVVENCDLWSGVQEDTSRNPRGAFYAHSQDGTETNRAKIILKNNRIVCDDSLVMCLESYGGIGFDCEFLGNYLYSKINGKSDGVVKGTNNNSVSFANGIYKNDISYGNNVAILN